MLPYGSVVTMCLKIAYTMAISNDKISFQFGGNVRSDHYNVADIDEVPDTDGEIVDMCKSEHI